MIFPHKLYTGSHSRVFTDLENLENGELSGNLNISQGNFKVRKIRQKTGRIVNFDSTQRPNLWDTTGCALSIYITCKWAERQWSRQIRNEQVPSIVGTETARKIVLCLSSVSCLVLWVALDVECYIMSWWWGNFAHIVKRNLKRPEFKQCSLVDTLTLDHPM